MFVRFARAAAAAALCLALAPGFAQKKVLDHDVYDIWWTLGAPAISHDGNWVTYTLNSRATSTFLVLVNATSGEEVLRVENFRSQAYSHDGRYLMYIDVPTDEERRNGGVIQFVARHLADGTEIRIDGGDQYTMAGEGTRFVLVRASADDTEGGENNEPPAETDSDSVQDGDLPERKRGHSTGRAHLLLDLETGVQHNLGSVRTAAWMEDESAMFVEIAAEGNTPDILKRIDLPSRAETVLFEGRARFTNLRVHQDGSLVFHSDKDAYGPEDAAWGIYVVDAASNQIQTVLDPSYEAFDNETYSFVTNASTFSENGRRIFFQIELRPLPEPEEEINVRVDVWHYLDPQVQSVQLNRVQNNQGNPRFLHFFDRQTGEITRVETQRWPNVTIADQRNGRFGLAQTNEPYAVENTWGVYPTDYALLNVETGEYQVVGERWFGNMFLSRGGRFLMLWDENEQTLIAHEIATGNRMDLTAKVPTQLFQDIDRPAQPGLHGVVGYLPDDEAVILMDRTDLWVVPLVEGGRVYSLTGEMGARRDITYRLLRLNADEEAVVDFDTRTYFTVFDNRNKRSGLAVLEPGQRFPEIVVLSDHFYSGWNKARDSERMIYRRERFEEFPNVWVVDNTQLDNPRQVSDANPQQAEYNWGTAELIRFTSTDGVPLDAVLIKPEDFDPGKKYPLISYFYEQNSQNLHRYRAPAPSASIINQAMFASNGYVIVIPDIHYKEGYPGQSAMHSIVPAVQEVLRRGYIDPDRMGIQGQSWGGYKVAYMITQTNMFAAAGSGAPVSNMISAYSGIRYGSGLLRQMQYEVGQSRIGGSLWEWPMRYYENSPVFFADRVQTPLLMMHNDGDGAVPWTEGVQFYGALRRFGKPVWMLNYNGEEHNLTQWRNRLDYSIRLHQFFDHYLKGEPMPEWMKYGIPARNKGRTLGLDLVED